jgi:hypothetical protein
MNDNTTARIKIQAENNFDLPNGVYRCVLQANRRFCDAKHLARKVLPHTKKISKDEYVILSSGEIREYNEKVNYMRQRENLKRTMNELRQLIRHNFLDEGKNQLHVTLTYVGGEMKDKERLFKDFDVFMKRTRRYLPDHQLEYITVAEPHSSGGWHMHLLLKSDKPLNHLTNTEFEKLWGQGFTKKKILKAENVGTYFVSYFTDLIINEYGQEMSVEEIAKLKGDEISKRRKKSARLIYYPMYFKFFRRSRGILDPPEKEITLCKIINEYGEPQYKRKVTISKTDEKGDNEKWLNEITEMTFDKKRGLNNAPNE